MGLNGAIGRTGEMKESITGYTIANDIRMRRSVDKKLSFVAGR